MKKIFPLLLFVSLLSSCEKESPGTETGSSSESSPASSAAEELSLISRVTQKLEEQFQATNVGTVFANDTHLFLNANHPNESGKRTWQIELKPEITTPAQGSQTVADLGEAASWGGAEPALLVNLSPTQAFRILSYTASAANDMETALADPARGHRWRDEATTLARQIIPLLPAPTE